MRTVQILLTDTSAIIIAATPAGGRQTPQHSGNLIRDIGGGLRVRVLRPLVADIGGAPSTRATPVKLPPMQVGACQRLELGERERVLSNQLPWLNDPLALSSCETCPNSRSGF